MAQTYDPILEVEDLRRFRLTAPVRGPVIGTALVLERTVGEPLVVWPGMAVPDARTGNYRRLHRVDVANRALELTTTVPSADPSFPFTVTIRMSCRVTDPVQIVRDGVHDMTAALASSFVGVARTVAARFDVLDPGGAEAEIGRRLNAAYPVAAVELAAFTVTVAAVDAEQIVTEQRKIRVGELRRTAMRPIAAGDRAEMLAHYMSLNAGDPSSYLEAEARERDAVRETQLDALRAVMGADGLEGYNASDIGRQAMATFFGDGAVEGGRRGRIRERIERKSRGELAAGDVVSGEVPDEQGNGNRHRSSRVRGTMRSREERPKDEQQ